MIRRLKKEVGVLFSCMYCMIIKNDNDINDNLIILILLMIFYISISQIKPLTLRSDM